MTTPPIPNDEAMPKPSVIGFERRYSDDSGVEFAVKYQDGEVYFVSVNDVHFPVAELDWLIACLQKIKTEIGP